jgi:hypothetical protein
VFLPNQTVRRVLQAVVLGTIEMMTDGTVREGDSSLPRVFASNVLHTYPSGFNHRVAGNPMITAEVDSD